MTKTLCSADTLESLSFNGHESHPGIVMETNRLPDLVKHLTEGNAALIVQNDNLNAFQRAKAVFSLHMALDGNPHVVDWWLGEEHTVQARVARDRSEAVDVSDFDAQALFG
jgi:hypothetical protein